MNEIKLHLFYILIAESLLLAAANSKPFYGKTDWSKAMGWCTHSGSMLMTGDFNGDGRADMLCHDSRGSKWVALANTAGQFTGTSWYKGMGWCRHSGSQLFLGDFDGDGRTDMLCHDTRGRKWVSLANVDGSFSGTSWQKSMGWCSHSGARLMIGDFNGDGRADMFCYDKRNKWIALAGAGGKFAGTHWHKSDGWCSHAGSSIFISDFNGDLRDDLLCHDNVGRNWVMLARADGRLSGRTDWHKSNQRWCSQELHLGYLNGDKRADMLCHRPSDGYKWIATAGTNVRGLFSGTTWHKAMNWCRSGSSQLFVADFNNDGKGDLLCHHRKTGKKWISYNRYPSKAPCSPNPCRNGAQCIASRRQPSGYACRGSIGFIARLCNFVKYNAVGCFKDNGGKKRPLPKLIGIFRRSINLRHMKKTVDKCAKRAKELGYIYFGIQFYGECWSGPNAKATYDKDGKSKYCWRGVGGCHSNFVYRIIN